MAKILATLIVIISFINNSFAGNHTVLPCSTINVSRTADGSQGTSALNVLVNVTNTFSNLVTDNNGNRIVSFCTSSATVIPLSDPHYNFSAIYLALTKVDFEGNNILYASRLVKLGEINNFCSIDFIVPPGLYRFSLISLYPGTNNPITINLLPPFSGSNSQFICQNDYFIDGCGYNISFEIPTTLCKNDPQIQLVGTPVGGVFSGSTGIVGGGFNPSLASSGLNEITYSYFDISLGVTCRKKKKTIVFFQKYIDRVISASSTTYSDTWPLDYTNINTLTKTKRDELDGSSEKEIANGTKGIWQGEESYVYVDKRDQNTPLVTLKNDGIFNNMPLFDHTSSLNAGCTPKWRLVNTITEYNPSSYDLENKDILNRYSSALYGYKGDLAIAVAANAREREIAYESFEEYTPLDAVTPEKLSSGNLALYTNNSPSTSSFYKVYRPYEIIEASDNVLTVALPFNQALGWNGKIVRIVGANMDSYDNKQVYGKYTVASVEAHSTDVTKSIISLSSSFTHLGIWKGKICVPTDYSTAGSIATGTANLSIVSTKKHTGKNSLKTIGDASFEQLSLELIPGEKYVLSAWISADQLEYTYRMLSGVERRGFTIEFFDNTGVSRGTQLIDINDKNPVIDGWQKIEGEFQFPATSTIISQIASRVVIHFKSPSSTTTYWDDIRLYPVTGNIQTYVYDNLSFKLSAVLDNNNYASLYYYDAQGNLFLVKKETEKGIQTIQESFSHQKE